MNRPPKGGRGICLLNILILFFIGYLSAQDDFGCPEQEKILPCRCSTKDMEFQIWCSHSELAKVLQGLNAVSRYVTHSVDELILENNNLPSLPGKVFTSLRVLRLMLRNNQLERLSSGWLEGLHDSLLELFIVEPDLRSIPIDSLDHLQGLEAITLQSNSMKRLPRFSGLIKLRYLQINSQNLMELSPNSFRDLPNLEQLHIFGSFKLVRLEAGLFKNLPKLAMINITNCGISWIHPRAFVDLPELREISFQGNNIPDASIIGRALIDLPALSVINLNKNRITRLQPEAFVQLPSLSRLYLSSNLITEIFTGAFQMLPNLRVLDINNNLINRIHPEFFIQRTGSSLEELWIMNNRLNHINELQNILEILPRLKLLDASHNHLEEIPFGALRGHPTLERLHLDHNYLTFIQRETFSAMPALRELRLRNNSLTNLLDAPFWNLPNLKGLDLADNYFRHVEPILLANLPNLRRLDMSGNGISIIEPDSFLNIPGLQHLNLSGNDISIIHPLTLRHLNGLFELDVGWNRLLEVIPGLPKNIEHLQLPMNRIIHLPALETQDLALPSLRSLDLSANGIERILPGTLSQLPALKKLNLGYNSIRLIEDGTFDGLVRLEQLDLKYNRIVSILGRSFKSLRSLMDLNLRGNQLETIRPDVFMDNIQLQRLDLARNNLAQIPHSTFVNTRNLKEFYASHNTLTELPGSLYGLESLEILDLSFNKLNILSPETLNSLSSLLQLKLDKNKIRELREGSFNRLPRLSFINLENNDLKIIERNSIQNLPELQAIRLGKNQIQKIPSGAFVDLPLLQNAQFEENRIEEIGIDAFINVPNILVLNLSYNLLPSLEHAGLSNLRSLEVLDLNYNHLTRVSNESLSTMEWLVELKMDNNRICGIQGTPFDNMPRLRVLTMRNNRMSTISENAVKKLRSNIAILDIDENPLSCSCNMLWLKGWLQQSASEGPKCADGSYFRDMRLSRQDCLQKKTQDVIVHPDCEAEMIDQNLMPPSHYEEKKPLPAWMNVQNHPLKYPQGEFYMYDDYHDDQTMENSNNSSVNKKIVLPTKVITSQIKTGPVKFIPSTIKPLPSLSPPSQSSTIVNKKKNPSPSNSGFTFFGVPLPNLNFKIWGNSGKKAQRKDDPFNHHIKRPDRPLNYPTYSLNEPKIHRGGFVPLPETQGGFTPIVDPRLIYNKQRLNETINKIVNRTGIITRVYQIPRDKNNKINSNEQIKNENNPTATTAVVDNNNTNSDTSALSSATDIQRVPSNTLNDCLNLDESILDNETENKSELQSTKVNGDLDVDSEETVVLEGKVASKIIWTTSKPDLKTIDVKNTTILTANDENDYLKDKNNFWDDTEEYLTLRKPTRTTPMIPDTSEDLIQVVTGNDSMESDFQITSTAMNEPIYSSQTSRALEASALSALLIPGGQIPSTPIISTRGRPIIEKVRFPFNNKSEKINSSIIITEKNLLFDIDSKELSTKNSYIDDDSFNWYFQNYNETNLEPFIGIAYSSQIKPIPVSIHLLTPFSIIIIIFN